MSRLAATATALALLASACGGGAGPRGAIEDTVENLADVRSGVIDLTFLASTAEGPPVGFGIEGPFALGEEADALPEAELVYTRYLGDTEEQVTFLSAGDAAFVEQDGTTRPVPVEDGSGAAADPFDGLRDLPLHEWVQEAESTVEDGEERVVARLDPVAATHGLFSFASEMGGSGSLPPLDEVGGEQLRRIIRSATLELTTGADDRILRHLAIEIELEGQVPAELQEALAELAGVRFAFEVGLTRANEPVEIDVP